MASPLDIPLSLYALYWPTYSASLPRIKLSAAASATVENTSSPPSVAACCAIRLMISPTLCGETSISLNAFNLSHESFSDKYSNAPFAAASTAARLPDTFSFWLRSVSCPAAAPPAISVRPPASPSPVTFANARFAALSAMLIPVSVRNPATFSPVVLMPSCLPPVASCTRRLTPACAFCAA